MRVAVLMLATSLLCACVTARPPSVDSPQQLAARDSLYKGCTEQRLFEVVDDYIDKQIALTQIGTVRYENFMCECTAQSAAKRPYVAATLARMDSGEELNSDGERILKGETFAALLQWTSSWLTHSADAIANQLGDAPRSGK
jgi:hypothetical protein